MKKYKVVFIIIMILIFLIIGFVGNEIVFAINQLVMVVYVVVRRRLFFCL